MFQYAAARRLAAHHGTTVHVDTSWFRSVPRGNTPRLFELDQLSITGTLSDGSASGVGNRVSHRLRPRYRAERERHFHFDPDVLRLPDGAWMSGYWQSEKYFADIAPIVRSEFTVRAEPSETNRRWLDRMSGCASVAVHIRRGDYARPSNPMGLLDVDYYARAARLVRARERDATFFVFSDDLDWVRHNVTLAGETCVVDHNVGQPSSEDLRLMSACRHTIIANSTFSWWAAWLNPNPDRIVVAPKRWTATPRFHSDDRIPADWIAI